jgi:multidrug efflux pump subunit AcrA (membrane-fusion protein)
VRLDALGRLEITARVSRLSHWLDPEKSRDMRVEVDLPNKDGRLKVGMYGSMTLVLQRFENAPLLPSSAIFVRGGKTCICEVVDGKAHLAPVRVQLEDGIRVKVAKLELRRDATLNADVETPVELTGDEVIVRSGQGEVHEGQEVRVSLESW